MKKLIALYNIASPSGHEKQMGKFIISELERMGVTHMQDEFGNIYAVKGNSKTYPCIVSHMDEVHRRKSGTYEAHLVGYEMLVGYDHKHKRMTGIGADDKNGIWICLKALEHFKRMKCVFFIQEEVGCIGSSRANMDFFANCRYVIQCDRKGNNDIVTQINMVEMCSNDFIQEIQPERYGYRICSGLTTDVYILKTRGLAVSCINLSCGYYNPHTDSEYTIWKDLENCFRFVCHIVKTYKTVSSHKFKRRKCRRYGLLAEQKVFFNNWRQSLDEDSYSEIIGSL